MLDSHVDYCIMVFMVRRRAEPQRGKIMVESKSVLFRVVWNHTYGFRGVNLYARGADHAKKLAYKHFNDLRECGDPRVKTSQMSVEIL